MSTKHLKINDTVSVGLPPMIFLYTLDQVASMLSVEEDSLRATYLYFVGRTPGVKRRHQMEAVNIAPEDQRADWRISQREFVQWLRRMGFKIHGLAIFS